MAPLRWQHETFVPVRPDDAYAWITDFRPDDHARPAYRRAVGATEKQAAKAHRQVVSREGDVVRLRDRWAGRAYDLTVTLDRPARALRVDGMMGYRATWSVTPSPGGARLRVEGEIASKGLFKLLLPLFAKGMLREMELDFRGHVADMVSELNPEGLPVE
ncbi:MAG TPA: SRPBCC family protein [Candidatus Thermoplasmatota archaeon]|nr:SRPBCC family protein [Candidatus Thermoplasmatota archaeon]